MDPASPSPAPKVLSPLSSDRTFQHGRANPSVEDQAEPSVLHGTDADDLIYQRYPSATPRQRVEIAQMIAAEKADEARKVSEKELRTKSTVNHTWLSHTARRRGDVNSMMAISRARAEKATAAHESEHADAHVAIPEERKGSENEDSMEEDARAATLLDGRADSHFDENTTEPDLNLPTWINDKRISSVDTSANLTSDRTAIDHPISGKRSRVKNKDSKVSAKGEGQAVNLITTEQAALILIQMNLVDAKLVS